DLVSVLRSSARVGSERTESRKSTGSALPSVLVHPHQADVADAWWSCATRREASTRVTLPGSGSSTPSRARLLLPCLVVQSHFQEEGMSRSLFCSVVAVVLLAVTPRPAAAWHNRGHMTVALIAYRQLSDTQKNKVQAILKEHPHSKEFLAAASLRP